VSLGVGGLPRSEVPAAFYVAAAGYDGLVGLNPGYHAHLRISARRLGIAAGGRGSRLLDAGCGTGASTAALLAVAAAAQIVAVDASAGMLAMAAGKRWPDSVRFVCSRVEDRGDAGVVGPFDGILAAYLIRNLADPDETLRRFAGLLRRGGRLAVHEYSVGDSRRATATWNAVCAAVIIPAGRLRSGDATLYRHLRCSVYAFDGASAIRERLRRNGFTDVRSQTMPGWQRDIVHTFTGTAPR
jgi:ubiquinone/menaquinone biosynthesis C-methylase UbiE